MATGSGSLHAGTVIKVGYQPGMTSDAAVELCVKALWVAADSDSATGGPDPLRGVYPVVATITAAGYERVGDDELAERRGRRPSTAEIDARDATGPSPGGDRP